MPEANNQENPASAMTFWEHLEELRRRIIVSLISVGFFMLLSLSFSKAIERIMKLPLDLSTNKLLAFLIDRIFGHDATFMGFLAISLRASSMGVEAKLIKDGPLEGIMAYLKISITFGILCASPILIYQDWAFVLPAFTTKEKQFALPLFLIIILFFIIGALFAYFIVAPVVLSFSSKLFEGAENLWGIEKYFNFLVQLLVGFGIAFELPIVMSFLSFINVIHANGFRQKRSIALVGIMVLSAFLTPADIISMLLMAIPLILLYELGIFFAFLVEQESEVHA